ncbi:MAG: cysteine peptidase family C39 domain-containing protein, partial [Kordia sp.]|uniref:cysteine peptidase family C39 domain-containing protein n=1 Tax=Kordia sp. TaxID=1965332 RepID=UPI00385BFB2F
MNIVKILWYIFLAFFYAEEEPTPMPEEPFPIIIQKSQMECGPTCLQMISKYYGVDYEIETLNKLSNLRAEGTSMGDIADTAELIGLKTLAVLIDYEMLLNDAPYPAMLHWKSRHFVIAYKVSKDSIWIADPANGLLTYAKEEFIPAWTDSNPDKEKGEGYVLVFETTEAFYDENIKKK